MEKFSFGELNKVSNVIILVVALKLEDRFQILTQSSFVILVDSCSFNGK